MEQKRVLGNYACPHPDCNSSDAYTVWEKDGKQDAHCFSCGYHVDHLPKDSIETYQRADKISTSDMRIKSSASPTSNQGPAPKMALEEGLAHPVRELKRRGISFSTCDHFGVRVGVSTTDGETPIYYLLPRYRNGNLIGWKTKTPQNDYNITGGSEVDLFGSWACKPSGKKIWITEGEIDALSVYQVLKENSSLKDWNPPVVSIPDGAASAVKALARCTDWLEPFDEICLVFDSDSAGQTARDEVCKLFAGKISYIDLPVKDPNEMLTLGRGTELKWQCLTHSKKYHPDGVVNAKDLWDRYKKLEDTQFYPWPSTMPILSQKTLGIQLGTIVTVTAGTGSGKSQFLREILYHLYKHTNEKIAGMFLEEDAGETVSGLMALDLNKRINLPDVKVPPEEEERSFDNLFGDGRISLYDYFGGMDDSSLLSKLRYFAITGHKFIFLDHLSIVVSEFAAKGGERERIDTLMTKLAKFVKEFNVALFLVVHLRKSEYSRESFELGAVPSLDDLRGSGTLKQLSWVVLALARNQQHLDEDSANTTELSVLKCRLTGRTGVADYLKFEDTTGRMIAAEKPLNYRPKKGKSL